MYQLTEIARFTPDVSTTSQFYSTLLGSQPTQQFDGMAEFDLGGITLRIHRTYENVSGEKDAGTSDGSDLPCEDHIAFAVENLEQACEEAAAHGLTCEVPPKEYQWGKSAYFRDPDGRLVEYHEKVAD